MFREQSAFLIMASIAPSRKENYFRKLGDGLYYPPIRGISSIAAIAFVTRLGGIADVANIIQLPASGV